MGTTRPLSARVMQALWVLAAVLAASHAISVPVEAGSKHRRQVPLSPAHSMQDIDKQFAAVGSHHHQQHQHQHADHKQAGSHAHPAAPPAGHKVGRRPVKQHREHVAAPPRLHAEPSNKHQKLHRAGVEHHAAAPPRLHAESSNQHQKHRRVGPKSLRRDHAAQLVSASEHVEHHSSHDDGLAHNGGHRAGKTHEWGHGKTVGGGHGEHHHYHHDHAENEKQDRRREYDEGEGARKTYDHDDYHNAAHGRNGYGAQDAEHEEFNRHDKNGFSKGYRDKYRKDEQHKLGKYWSNGREKGAYEKFGEHLSHHAESDKEKVKKSQHKEGKKSDGYGKKGHYGKGHYDTDHKGHRGHGGRESQYAHHDDYGKKGGTSYGKDHHYEHGKGRA